MRARERTLVRVFLLLLLLFESPWSSSRCCCSFDSESDSDEDASAASASCSSSRSRDTFRRGLRASAGEAEDGEFAPFDLDFAAAEEDDFAGFCAGFEFLLPLISGSRSASCG